MEVEKRKEMAKEEKEGNATHVVRQGTWRGIAHRGKEHRKEADQRVRGKEKTAHGFADSIGIAMFVENGATPKGIARGGLG